MKNLFWILAFLSFTMPSFSQPAGSKQLKFLALGDSYTIGESVDEHARWPVQLVDSLRKRGKNICAPVIIATTGWRTDDLRKAVDEAKLKDDFGLVGLLIGVNNQFQGKDLKQYGVEFEELLKMAIAFAGGKKENVFVVSIPDYGFTPFGASRKATITQAIDSFNDVNKIITQSLGIRYVNITDISRQGLIDTDLVAADGLHPSGKMYTLWVEKVMAGMK